MNVKTQARDILGGWIPSTPDIDMDRLPYFMKDILTRYLIPKNEQNNAPVHLLIMNLCGKCAQVVAHNRAKFLFPHEKIALPINFYGLAFAPSGISKTKSSADIQEGLMQHFTFEFNKQVEKYVEDKNAFNKGEARSLYPKSKAQQIAYMKENSARTLKPTFEDATPEAFAVDRAAYQDAGFGAVFVEIEEFADFICKEDAARSGFLSALTKCFDKGNLGVKSTKGEKHTKPTLDVPVNAILYTSPEGLLQGANNKKLMTFLGRGMARRSFVCYVKREEIKRIDINQDLESIIAKRIENGIKTMEAEEELSQYFIKAFYYTLDNQVIPVSEKATRTYMAYHEYCKIREQELQHDIAEGLRAELSGRSWKTIKLAGIIAAFEHPERMSIEEQDILYAVYLAESYGFQFKKFYAAEVSTDNEKLFAYFADNLDKWITKPDVKKQNWIPSNVNFTQWFEETIKLVETMTEDTNYQLVEVKTGNNKSYKYKLTQIEITAPEDFAVRLSVAPHQNAKDPYGYVPEMVRFDELHTIVNSCCSYSGSVFEGNHRKIDNCIEVSNMIIYDIDDGTTIEEARTKLEGVKYLITTSRNHQKIKGTKEACDRFRIFIPLNASLPKDNNEYKKVVKNVALKLGLMIDAPVVEVARFFFGNPEGEYFYGESNELLNLTLFESEDEQPEEKKPQAMVKQAGQNAKGRKIKDVLGTDEALRRYEFYDGNKGYFEGNIDNFLLRISRWLLDEGIPQATVEQEIRWLSSLNPTRGKNTHTIADIQRVARKK